MKISAFLFSSIIFAAVLIGCTSIEKEIIKFSFQYISFTSSIYEKTDKNEIKVYETIKDIPEKYEEIGVYKVTGEPNYEILKVSASENGGNGLLKTTRGIILIRLLENSIKKGNNDAKI